MKLVVIAVFLVIAAAVGSTADQEKPVPPLSALGPDPTITPTVVDTASSIGDVGWPLVGCIAVGLVAGVVFSVLAGTGAVEFPRWRWPIWGGLVVAFTMPWIVAAKFVPSFTAFTGWAVMVAAVLFIDFLWGGRSIPVPPVRKEPGVDESRRDVIPPSVVVRGRGAAARPRVPTWRDWQTMSWDIQAGVSVIEFAQMWGMSPDAIARGVRDFRVAEDRWEDTINGAPTTPAGGVVVGRDLAEEIRDTGWDAFLAATSMRLLDQTTDPGNDGRDVVLFEVTGGPWAGERVLQVIDASLEDGIHRRVGIPVGREHTNAGAALADTWGLTPEQYQPARHT